MELIGTNATFSSHDTNAFRGSIIMKSITVHNAADFYMDESISAVGSGGSVSSVR
jgi:hypothetical protein